MIQKLAERFLRVTAPRRHVEDTIVVLGAPRSGTTWLAEILRERPGGILISEPLRSQSARLAGFDSRTYVAVDDRRPALEAYLKKCLVGDVSLANYQFRAGGKSAKALELLRSKSLVVKFCRLNRILHWFADRFTVKGGVIIVRHPCAVIPSMMKYASYWQSRDVSNAPFSERFGGRVREDLLDRLKPLMNGGHPYLRYRAAMWALNHRFILHADYVDYLPFTLVTYEDLVLNPQAELRRIVSEVDLQLTQGMMDRLNKKSTTASGDLALRDPVVQLNKWKNELASSEVDAILEVVHAMDIDFYSDAVISRYRA